MTIVKCESCDKEIDEPVTLGAKDYFICDKCLHELILLLQYKNKPTKKHDNHSIRTLLHSKYMISE